MAELPSHRSYLQFLLLAQQCGSGKEGVILEGFWFGTLPLSVLGFFPSFLSIPGCYIIIIYIAKMTHYILLSS